MTIEWLPVGTENLLSGWSQNGTMSNDSAQQQWSNQEQADANHQERLCSWRLHVA
jgi:hypothetical protein